MQGEQHAFHLSITAVFTGTYEVAFKKAMAAANELYDENVNFELAKIVVTDTGMEHLGDADGVFCEGCDGHVFSGIRWPTAAGGDTSREWVERCDTCERFESDKAAMEWLRENYGDDNVKSYGVIDQSSEVALAP